MMKIGTYQSFIKDKPGIIKEIAAFWDDISFGWRKIWGEHIHHGYYSDNPILNTESDNDTAKDRNLTNLSPQEILIEKIVALLNVQSGQSILDVGCGMGGTSIYLANKYNLKVTGITLSSKQKEIAEKSLYKQQSLQNQQFEKNKNQNIQFKIEDAHTLKSFAANQFDIVWSLESCEQFYDKELFIKEAFRVLKPNGKLMIATWCSEKEYFESKEAKIYKDLSKSFQLPYMPTIQHYSSLIGKYFTVQIQEDWSLAVKISWQLGLQKLKSFNWLQLIRLGGITGLKFVRKLQLMSDAFQSGQIRYGVFVAVKN